MPLILYGAPLSPFYRKAEMVMREKSVSFEAEMVNIMPMPDWFKQISPARRIPVLRDTDIGAEGVLGTVPDSSAICAFVDQKHPEPPIYPKDPYERGRAVWLEEYADSEMANPVGAGIFRPIMFNKFQKKDPDLDTARKTWQETLPRHFDYLEETLGDNDFFVGNALSIADVAITCQFTQLQLVAGLPDASRWPNLVGYLERMVARPSLTENLTICRKIVKESYDLS